MIDVTDHNNPVWKMGARGTSEENFVQPTRVVVDSEGTMFVSDTGNSRIKVIKGDGDIRHIGPVGLESQGGTGVGLTPNGNLAIVNWRTKFVSILSKEGDLVNQFTYPDFSEPTDVAVNSRGEIIVADNGANKIFMFDSSGRPLTTFGGKGEKEGQFKLISAIAVGKCDEILVADHRIQIFSKDGKFSRTVPEQRKGQFGGLSVDSGGFILASKTEKGKSFIQVLNASGKLLFVIDSFEDRLRRPSGLAVMPNHHVLVVDLGNDCIKKYRYK